MKTSTRIKMQYLKSNKPRVPLPAVYRPMVKVSLDRHGQPRIKIQLSGTKGNEYQPSRAHWNQRPEKVSNGKRSAAKQVNYFRAMYEGAMLSALENELRHAGFRWRDYELKRVPETIMKEVFKNATGYGPLIWNKFTATVPGFEIKFAA